MRKISLLLVLVAAVAGIFVFFHFQPSQAQKDSPTENAARRTAAEEDYAAQKPVARIVRTVKNAGASFDRRELFQTTAKRAVDDKSLRRAMTGGDIVSINQAEVDRILADNTQFITLPLPDGKGGTVELELVRTDIFAPGFKVKTSVPTRESLDDAAGVHFRGIVKGDDRSLVAISIFRREIMGFFSTETGGNSIVGRLGGTNRDNKHIIYAEADLREHPKYVCATKDDLTPPQPPPATANLSDEEAAARCVKFYLEANTDLFNNKGSVTNTANYLIGVFNQSAVLYANEGIPISISEIFVWNSASPYTGTSSSAQLNLFKAARTSFNGDLAHLFTLQNYGGIAYLNVLCNRSFGYGFSGIFANYSNVPTYSWTVNVFTHETGHNLGSSHTHACVWNGNNTAIDSCGPEAGYPYEGSCSGATLPPNGGTIMSYCHLLSGVGINLALGFGQQPRDVMVARFNSAACLTNCSLSATTGRQFDYDGDGKSDLSVFRPSNGYWYLQQSRNGFVNTGFGISGDLIAPADYDGDGKTDLAVFRPSTGTWYLLRSTAGFAQIQFGANGDTPMPADFSGDGKAELAIFRPSTGVWYQYNLLNSQTNSIAFGINGDTPAAGDYDGDGKADVAVFRPSNGTWYLQRSQLGFTQIQFGASGDKAVAADYDGDGKADLAVFRPSNGTWYLQRSTAGFTNAAFGITEDLPAPADFDGDGKTDLGIFRPSSGVWYLQRSTQGFTAIQFGASGDKPTPNAYVP